MATRRSYSASFKLTVVQELAGGAPAQDVADRHGVTPSMVRKWLTHRAELEAAVAHTDGAQLKLGCGRKPTHEAVDDALLLWVESRRERGERTTEREMQEKARDLAAEQGIADFRASKGYISNFKRRNKLATRGSTKKRRRSGSRGEVVTTLGELAVASSVVEQAAAAAAVNATNQNQSLGIDLEFEGATTTPELTNTGLGGGPPRDCMFGMDLGLKCVKCAVCSTTGGILATSSAAVEMDEVDKQLGKDERNVDNVLLAVQKAIREIPMPLRKRIRSVGICGVMHGILWWKCDSVRVACNELLSGVCASSTPIRPWSSYITFMDQRCTPTRLDEWRAKIELANTTTSLSGTNDNGGSTLSSRIATGHGLATFACMLEERPQDIARFDTCGTIHDFVAFALCGHSLPSHNCIDTTDAFSWGGFDINTKNWNPRTVQALGLPLHVLPTVKDPGAIMGQTTEVSAILGLPNGVPVYLPMGDNPCAVMTTIAQTRSPEDFNLSRTSVLSIGSASQLALVLTAEDAEELKKFRGNNILSFEVRPFLSDNWFLGVAGSKSGGNIFEWFMKQCQEWSRQLLVLNPTADLVTEDAMYAQLIALGHSKLNTDLKFSPTLFGEWATPSVKGSIEQLQANNWSLGDISASICRGLIDNIFNMVPSDLRDDLLCQPMIGTGQALTRNSLLRHFVEQKLSHPTQLSLDNTADSAVGVAFIPLLLQK